MRSRLVPAVLLCLVTLARAARISIVVHVPAETPAGADVYLAGSIAAVGSWRADGVKLARQPDGTFTGTIEKPDDATLEYKFDCGTWDTVELQADGSDQPNRTLIGGDAINASVARWKAGPAAWPSTIVGTLRTHVIASAALGQSRTVRVWLPPGYDRNPQQRYPVLYLHDGQNCFDRRTAFGGHEWEIDETLTKLIDAKAIPPLIVVGLDNGGADRLNEYTFAKDATHGGGGGESHATFILDEVRPFIARTYRVLPDAAHTYLGGSSLGGLSTLEIARRHPGIFGGMLVMSPSLWWAKESVLTDLDTDAKPLAGTRIWIDIGTAEEPGPDGEQDVTRTQRLDAILTHAHVEHRLSVDPGAHHNEEAWAKRFPAAMTYLLGSS